MGVAELEPPTATTTSWDFSYIDPVTEDALNALAGHPVVLNFTTIPEWMFKTPETGPYPADPTKIDWDYDAGYRAARSHLPRSGRLLRARRRPGT